MFVVGTRLLLVATLTALGGCELIGFAAHVVAGGEDGNKVIVDAEYRGLAQKSVAVMVSADEYTLFEYPTAPADVRRQVCSTLTTRLPDVKVVDPQQIEDFQTQNPFWTARGYGDLLERLGVDRLLHIGLVRYALHERGNTYQWRGVITANIGVAEADGTEPNDFAYATTLQAEFPPGGSIGLLDADHRTTQFGLLRLFAHQLANRFQDHEVVKK